MKKNRLKAMSSTAQKIKCKATGLKLIEADSSRDNSRAFYKLPNGEYLSRNTEAMKKYLDEKFPQRIEHDGTNIDRHTGEAQINEKYHDIIRKLKK